MGSFFEQLPGTVDIPFFEGGVEHRIRVIAFGQEDGDCIITQGDAGPRRPGALHREEPLSAEI